MSESEGQSKKSKKKSDEESLDEFDSDEIFDDDVDESEIENDNNEDDLDDDFRETNDEDEEDYEISESNNIGKSNQLDEDDDDIFEYVDPEEEKKVDLRVPDNERVTIPRLTKYERVRILGTRIKQISDGSKIFIKSNDIKNATSIAELELKHKVIPLKIKRPLPNGRYEIWSLNELDLIE